MAGHSHFKNIKRKKEQEDRKKSSDFSKISRLILSAVREKGKDPQVNLALKQAIEKAKSADMPKENIEKAIKRGSGEGDEGKLEYFLLEAYGPENTAFIIEGNTDNKNRTIGEIKEILKKYNGKIADPGAVKWLFDQKGIIEIENNNKEETILKLIESGVEDIVKKDDIIFAYVAVNELENIKTIIQKEKIDILASCLGWVAKATIIPKANNYKELLTALQNNDSVEEVYINI